MKKAKDILAAVERAARAMFGVKATAGYVDADALLEYIRTTRQADETQTRQFCVCEAPPPR